MQDDLRDQPRGRGHQQVVGADLHPVLAASRALQSMTTPVIDYVVLAAIAWRQLAAAVQVAIGAGATVRSTGLRMVGVVAGLGRGIVLGLRRRALHVRRAMAGRRLVHLRTAMLRLLSPGLGRCQRC